LTCRNVETASIKAAVTVGVNALITSGKERGIINASWNVCEVKKRKCLIFLHVLQGNSNAFSAKATTQSIVYSAVASSLACMSNSVYFPIFHVSPNNLRITCQNIEWNFCLLSIEFSHEVEYSFSNTNSLIVWQDDEF